MPPVRRLFCYAAHNKNGIAIFLLAAYAATAKYG